MPLDGEYEPSPAQWVRDQVDLYESSRGTEGTTLRGMPVIVLSTLGAKSGKVRKTPLVRVADDEGRYAVIGSMGGAPTHPQWVHNVRADPRARLQDGARLLDYAVHEATGDEKARWWARAVAVWPDYGK